MREQCPQCHKEYQQHRRIYTELMSSVERSAYREQFPAITKPASRVALHHGTGCRYGMCAKHCTCATPERKGYREVRRNERTSHVERTGYTCCSQCNASTGHRHARYVVFEGEAYGSRGLHRTTVRKCALHCDHPECTEVLSCTERQFPIVLTTCMNCAKVFDKADTTTERGGRTYCLSCAYSGTDMRICTNAGCSGWQQPGNICTECGACYHETDENVPTHCHCAAITRPRLVRCPTHYNYLNAPAHIHCDSTNPVPRGIGVEIEVCGFNKPKRAALERLYNVCLEHQASIGTDGSVGDNGIEIRTAPIIGKIAVEHITEICKALHDANAIVDQRCGLHVHVDVRHVMERTEFHPNYMHFGLRNGLDTMLIAWRMLEDTFYDMVPNDRWIAPDDRQMYCKKLFTANTMPWEGSANALSYAVSRGWFATTRTLVRDRYRGFNTQAFDKYQTVEFRLHEGTINAQDILSWSMLCAAFVDTCVRAPKPEELLGNIMDMGPIAFLQYIAPSQAARDYVTRRVS